jgi:hypothetical protein
MSIVQNIETLPQQRGGNYEVARFNALRHGILSQHTVLPWEDGEEYRALLEALLAEHQPRGPTEEHLVEELAGIIWRKRRLRRNQGKDGSLVDRGCGLGRRSTRRLGCA